MTRTLVFFLIAGLVLAPAASAKGPHAVLSSGPEAVEPGKAWLVTVELMESAPAKPPILVARRGDRRFSTRARRQATGYRLRVVFPTAGRWGITLVGGKCRFVFPAVSVGTGRAPSDYIAFEKGSQAERQGAGGVWTQGPEPVGSGGNTSLPPEVITIKPAQRDGGISLWIPALGLALAGAGAFTFRRTARRAP